MKDITKSRRAFVRGASSLAGLGAASAFLAAASPVPGFASASVRTDRGGVAGQAFLQVTLYEGIPGDVLGQFFEAVDQHYTSVLLKAQGLISYQRFKHFDLPQTLDLQLWDSRPHALAFYDGEVAQRAWKLALDSIPPKAVASISKDYLIQHHSNARRHYILSKSFKG